MSNISGHGQADDAPGGGGTNSGYVDSWSRTRTLDLLRELLMVSGHVGPSVARRAGLSRSELAALELLMERQVGPVELAGQLGVTSAASSGIVDRLEARGHVAREPDAQDGRRRRVVVTDSGREDVLGHLMPMFLALRELDSTLDEEERRVVDRYLEGAIAALRRLL